MTLNNIQLKVLITFCYNGPFKVAYTDALWGKCYTDLVSAGLLLEVDLEEKIPNITTYQVTDKGNIFIETLLIMTKTLLEDLEKGPIELDLPEEG